MLSAKWHPICLGLNMLKIKISGAYAWKIQENRSLLLLTNLLLLTSINFDSSMNTYLYILQSVGWNYLSISKLQ